MRARSGSPPPAPSPIISRRTSRRRRNRAERSVFFLRHPGESRDDNFTLWPPLGCREAAALALGEADAGLALEDQQVEGRSLAFEAGQQAVRLATVMGLVVEEMQQQRHQRLLDLSRVAQRAIAYQPVEVGLAEPG